MKAIIIGATSGIGRETAVRLIRKGWTVGLAGRRLDRLESIRNEYGADKVHIARMDVTSEDAIEAINSLIGETGFPDLFFYVAGNGFQNRELDIDKEILMVRTNCEGMVRSVDYFINYVRSHPEYYSDKRKGHVAVVSSIAGTAGLGVSPAYSATKKMESAYISALAQLSSIDKIPVDFTDIRPGFVATEFLNPDKRYPMMMSVEKAAGHIVRAIEKRKRVCIFDWRFRILVFFWRLIPRFIWERLSFIKN